MSDSEDRPEAPGQEWAVEPLSALGSWVGGGTPSRRTPAYWSNGTIPWVTPKDMKAIVLNTTSEKITHSAVENSAAKTFLANSIAFVVRSGILEHTLPVALIPFSGTANQDMRVLTPRQGIDPEWLLYALLGHAPEIRRGCSKQGTTVASIEVSKLMEYKISIPPFDQQGALAGRIRRSLDQLGRAAAELDRASEQLTLLHKAAIEGMLRLGHHLPEGWRWRALDEVANLSAGGTPSRNHPEYFGGDVPWIKIGDLNERTVTVADESITRDGIESSSAELLEPGVVLLAMYGASIGRTGILGVAGATNQAICAMQPKSQRIRGDYLHRLLRANKQTFVAAGYGGAQPNISQRYLQSFQVPVPPIPIQDQILKRIAELDEGVSETASVIRKCRAHQATLRRALIWSSCEQSSRPRVSHAIVTKE
jgi:type I restriction enzyme S subunit